MDYIEIYLINFPIAFDIYLDNCSYYYHKYYYSKKDILAKSIRKFHIAMIFNLNIFYHSIKNLIFANFIYE